MTHTLNIDQPALTRFKQLPKPIQRILITKAQVLKTHPLTGQSLQGKYRLLRLLPLSIEGTAYRILYQIFQKSETIVIRLAATRANIYQRLDEMKLK